MKACCVCVVVFHISGWSPCAADASDRGQPDLSTGATCAQRAKIGRDALNKEEYARAITELKRALECTPHTNSDDLRERAFIAGHLGAAYCGTGRYRQAEVDFRYALAIWHELAGDNTSVFASELSNIGTTCLYSGYVDEAHRHFVRALEIDEAIFGSQSHVIGNDLNNLATVCINKRRFSEAEKLLRRAIGIAETDGKDSKLAAYKRNLASVFTRLGRFKDALVLQRDTLNDEIAMKGRAHPKVGLTLTQVAISESALRQCDRSIAHAHQAIEILQTSFGLQHQNTAAAYYVLGLASECAKQTDAAQAALYRAVDIEHRLEQPGEYHAAHLRVYARILRALHRNSEAQHYEDMAAAADASRNDAGASRNVVDVMELER